MPRKKLRYDRSCYDLAKAFLSDEPQLDTPENADVLAGEIQLTIEDEILHMRIAQIGTGED